LAKYVLGQWEINRAAKRKQLIQWFIQIQEGCSW
jgi:hypothetical protein